MLNGGDDDDLLALLDPAFLEGFGAGGGRMLGGTGSGTLRLDGTGVSLDLGAIPDTRFQGIERVDTSGIDTAAVSDVERARSGAASSRAARRFRAGVSTQSEVF